MNESDLIQRIAKGDESAFEVLFDSYQSKLFSAAVALTRSTASAEEIVQDVFLKLWLRRERLTGIEQFSSYVYTMLRNESYNWLHKQARRARLLDAMPMHQQVEMLNAESFLEIKEISDQLQHAIDALPTQQKLVFVKMKEEGLSREQTAAALNIDPNTVKTHMSRALKSLRAYIIAKKHIMLFSLWL